MMFLTPPCNTIFVSLLVRLWVEILLILSKYDGQLSASLWGCELKWTAHHSEGYPLKSASLWGCELKYETIADSFVQELSASLWGCELKCTEIGIPSARSDVSLLVRLWVEMFWTVCYLQHHSVSLLVRLWVEITVDYLSPLSAVVSLLVRLWVEIIWKKRYERLMKSASLWGCELKYIIWFPWRSLERSASLWGCELKCRIDSITIYTRSQPPCEAVSWNIIRSEYTWDDCTSASLWGCELKWLLGGFSKLHETSASLWGCELK